MDWFDAVALRRKAKRMRETASDLSPDDPAAKELVALAEQIDLTAAVMEGCRAEELN
jgi:hypothetical protein